MGFIEETKDLVFGKLNMVGDKVNEKVDFAQMKVTVTEQYTKAIATVEEVPVYLKDAYKTAMAKIEDLHIYDNAVYASQAAVDPTTYKKLFDSALNAVDAFKQALVTFTKQTTGSVLDTLTATKQKLLTTSVDIYQKSQHAAVAGAVWVDQKANVIDMVNWSLDKTTALDNKLLGGRAQMITTPVVGYTLTKAQSLDNIVTGGAVQGVVNDVTIDFGKTKAMQFITVNK